MQEKIKIDLPNHATLDDAIMAFTKEKLKINKYNKTHTAKDMNIAVRTLRIWIKSWEARGFQIMLKAAHQDR